MNIRNKVSRIHNKTLIKEDIPGVLVTKTPCYQCRRPRFDHWSEIRFHMAKLRARMPQLQVNCEPPVIRPMQPHREILKI